MRIYHLALASHWEAAVAGGSYTTSTLGRTLEEEGFIHCAQESQVAFVRATFYAEVEEPVVVLTVDTALLRSPWRLDDVPGADQPFPHVYGPIDVDAVVAVTPLLPEPTTLPDPTGDTTDETRPARTYAAG